MWFDDLTVTHTQSLVVQASDYGVWGDVLREQRADEKKYRFGYQGQFAEKDEETGWSHFELREFDPVIGRWLVKDPMREFWSPYVSMGNNPVNRIDPTGGCTDCPPKKGDMFEFMGTTYIYTSADVFLPVGQGVTVTDTRLPMEKISYPQPLAARDATQKNIQILNPELPIIRKSWYGYNFLSSGGPGLFQREGTADGYYNVDPLTESQRVDSQVSDWANHFSKWGASKTPKLQPEDPKPEAIMKDTVIRIPDTFGIYISTSPGSTNSHYGEKQFQGKINLTTGELHGDTIHHHF